MSLVNKMLRDLDARRAGNGDRAALPAAVTPLAARQESDGAGSRLLPGVLLAIALLGAGAWYATLSRSPESPAVPSVPAPPVAALPVAPVASATPAVAEPVRSPVAAPAPAVQADIPSLRLAAELSALPAVSSRPERKVTAVTAVTAKMPERAAASSGVAAVAVSKAPLASLEVRVDKQVRLPSAAERAESEYRRGVAAQRSGNVDVAVAGYRAALADYPEHLAARQTLAALLIEAKRFDEAEEVLLKGTELTSARLASTLALARLKVERNQAGAALELLQKNAVAGENSAEYQGFAGALLNRAGRAADAVERYQAAVRLAPNEARWWAGLGIALDSAGRTADAREAYQKARALPGLPADLAQHIEQRLR